MDLFSKGSVANDVKEIKKNSAFNSRYIINNPCMSMDLPASDPPWEMVVVVTSNARNFGHRRAQREAFPRHLLRREGIKRVFLLARDPEVDQTAVEGENAAHGDIVQGDFNEAYRNLAFKHVMGLQWAARYCGQSK